jgi:hypothetical protein
MEQSELRKEAEEAYKKIDDGTGFYMGDVYFIDGYVEGAKARQKELDEAVEILRKCLPILDDVIVGSNASLYDKTEQFLAKLK